LNAFELEAAKGIKTQEELADFQKMLTKITVLGSFASSADKAAWCSCFHVLHI
jgi:hypothetical protein